MSGPVMGTEWGVKSAFRFDSQWKQVAGCARLWDRFRTLRPETSKGEDTTPRVRASRPPADGASTWKPKFSSPTLLEGGGLEPGLVCTQVVFLIFLEQADTSAWMEIQEFSWVAGWGALGRGWGHMPSPGSWRIHHSSHHVEKCGLSRFPDPRVGVPRPNLFQAVQYT